MSSGELENWSPQQVADALKQGNIVLIDVRTPQEYLLEHIENALLAPTAWLKPEMLPCQVDKRIVLHCGSGKRSGMAGEKCLAGGLTKMAHMEGGLSAWKKAGLPYIGTDLMSASPKPMTDG